MQEHGGVAHVQGDLDQVLAVIMAERMEESKALVKMDQTKTTLPSKRMAVIVKCGDN